MRQWTDGLGIHGLAGEDEEVAEAEVARDHVGVAAAQRRLRASPPGKPRGTMWIGSPVEMTSQGSPVIAISASARPRAPRHRVAVEVLAEEGRLAVRQAVDRRRRPRRGW